MPIRSSVSRNTAPPTSSREKLSEWGIEVHRGVGKTGVVGVLRDGQRRRSRSACAPTWTRCRSLEANDLRLHSRRTPGACTPAATTATPPCCSARRTISRRPRNFNGTVNFIFQPAEEGLGGARAMLEDGLFERFPCDAVFGMHNRPGLPVGKFAIRPGAMMAGGAFFDIHVNGKGAHGARPEQSVDPVLVACHIATALQSIVSRNVSALDAAVVSVTAIKSGDAYNVIPQTAEIRGTVRTFTNEVMDADRREHAAHRQGRCGGVRRHGGGRFPRDLRADGQRCGRDRQFCRRGRRARRRGERRPRPRPDHGVGGFLLHAGSTAGRLHQHRQRRTAGSSPVHNPGYDFNDAILPLGAAALAGMVEKKLPRFVG